MATILFTLLLGSGLGSRFAPRFGDRLPFLAIAAWLALFGRLTHAMAGLPAALVLGGLAYLGAMLLLASRRPWTAEA